VDRVLPSEFVELTRPLVGLEVSRPWRGYGSCVVLELGPLVEKYRASEKPRGRVSIMMEWSWRVQTARAVSFGSWSSERKMNNGIARLEGMLVQEISIEGRLPELSVRLSGNRWLRSFMTAEGQPSWCVRLDDGSWLSVQRGVIGRWTSGERA
jgi:hypothetical protein